MENKAYIKARNNLIPIAEKFANKKHGTSQAQEKAGKIGLEIGASLFMIRWILLRKSRGL